VACKWWEHFFFLKKMTFIYFLCIVISKRSFWDSLQWYICIVFGFDQPCAILWHFIMSVTFHVLQCGWNLVRHRGRNHFVQILSSIHICKSGKTVSSPETKMNFNTSDIRILQEEISCALKKNLQAFVRSLVFNLALKRYSGYFV
jgi:hypothetical protein